MRRQIAGLGTQRVGRRLFMSTRPTPPVFPRAIDAHCHLHDGRLAAHVSGVMERAVRANISHVATCACYEEDWRVLERLLSIHEVSGHQDEGEEVTRMSDTSSDRSQLKIIPSFGIHPWWANTTSVGYLDMLRATLMKYPHALLGEIGLCKSVRGKQVDITKQEKVFREQLQLAVEMQRPCVIHCVGAYGKLLDVLQSEQKQRKGVLPPAVILHSYSGAPEMIPAFLALELKAQGATKFFFSLNAKQLASRSSKVEAVCVKVPLEALLLETDAPDQAPILDPATVELFSSRGVECERAHHRPSP